MKQAELKEFSQTLHNDLEQILPMPGNKRLKCRHCFTVDFDQGQTRTNFKMPFQDRTKLNYCNAT